MSEEKRIPAIGQTVWVKMTCQRHHMSDSRCSWRGMTRDSVSGLWPDRNAEWLPDPLPTAEPRQPWQVLREAGLIMRQRGCLHHLEALEREASNMERDAALDPLDIVRRVAALCRGPDTTLIDDARRCIAAHTAKREAK
jgi:hypothetical protein